MNSILSPSGGLVYHWRYFRNHNLWSPFIENIGNWLMANFSPNHTGKSVLIIFGASSGACLSTRYLDQYHEIICVDRDIVSKIIFKAKYWSINHKTRYLVRDFVKVRDILNVLDPKREAAVLFSNVLGQGVFISNQSEKKNFLDFIKNIPEWIEHRPCASFHDYFSSEHQPIIKSYIATEKLSMEQILELFYKNQGHVEGFTHETDNRLPALPMINSQIGYYVWQIKPYYFHIIESKRIN